jgi:hypothetical protein
VILGRAAAAAIRDEPGVPRLRLFGPMAAWLDRAAQIKASTPRRPSACCRRSTAPVGSTFAACTTAISTIPTSTTSKWTARPFP